MSGPGNYQQPTGVLYPNGQLMGVLLYTWDVDSLSPVLFKGPSNQPLVPPYDAVKIDTSASTSDVYSFYVNGTTGTLVAKLTLNYTDSTKGTLSSVVRS